MTQLNMVVHTAQSMFRLHHCLFVVPFLLLAGCAPAGGRLAVSGAVTFDGKPLELGTISFQPVETETPNTSAITVRNGTFAAPAERGLPPGAYRVTVQALQPTGRKVDDPEFGSREELAQLVYRERDLKATVAADKENHFDFHLTSPEAEEESPQP